MIEVKSIMTETWLKEDQRKKVPLSELLPLNNDILHQPRDKGHGARVAAIQRKDLLVNLCRLRKYDFLEHTLTKIIISLYQ